MLGVVADPAFGPVDDLGGTESAQVVGLLHATGRGDDAVAEPREQRDRHRAEATRRARDEHRSRGTRRDAVALEREHGEHCREARGADRRGTDRREHLGQAHEPLAACVRPLREAARVPLTDTPSGEDDAIAGSPQRRVRRRDGADEVDARDAVRRAQHAGSAREREAVLEVDARVRDVHDDVLVAEFGVVDLDDRCARAVR